MTENYHLVVEEEEEHLDKVIAEKLKDLSRTKIKELANDKNILVNHKAEKIPYKVQAGDSIDIIVPLVKPLSSGAQNLNLDIVYGDTNVIVINKPQGVVVHPSAGYPDHILVNGLLYHTHELADSPEGFRPDIVHRIDRDTSGLLVVAKNDKARESLEKQLAEKISKREYLAIVHGNLETENGVIDAPIGRSPSNREQMAVNPKGKAAVTHFIVFEQFKDYSLVEYILEAGRTHQTRVHMKYIGHPLAGDPLYRPKKALTGHGQFLHAETLGFYQPFTHKWLELSAPLPATSEKQLENLRQEVRH